MTGLEARIEPARGRWTEELGEAFLVLLRETGNARASARALGERHLFNNRMRRHPGFRRDCEAAIASADARLSRAESPFLAPIEAKSMPPDDPDLPDGPPGRRPKKPTRYEPVIRRTSNRRLQISHVPEGGWTSEVETEFLSHLRATGNFDASAKAVGFHGTTLLRRLDSWPAFARDCEAALVEAGIRLDYKLIAHAHALLRRPGEPSEDGEADEPDVPFDPVMAMRILAFIDRRRHGRTGRGRRRGLPERPLGEAVESILAKIEAIERHEKMMRERRARRAAVIAFPEGAALRRPPFL